MKYLLIILLSCLLSPSVKSQTDTTIQYYKDYWEKSNKRKAMYMVKTYVLDESRVCVEKSYISGQMIDKITYKSTEFLIKDGPYQSYYYNNKLREEGYYSNDLRDSLWTFYSPQRLIIKKGSFKEGIRDGVWEFYDGRGQLTRKCGYVDGEYSGDYVSYDNKQKLEEGKFINNQEVGLWKGWYNNGKLKYEGNYAANDEDGKTGTWTYYYPSGAIASTEVFTDASEPISTYYNEAGDEIPFEGEALTTEPEFIGGPSAMSEFIANNVDYPETAREMGEQGVVYVQFIVMRDGTVNSVTVRKGVSPALDAEALRVIEMMPLWKPGELKGRPVKVKFTIPINFRLG